MMRRRLCLLVFGALLCLQVSAAPVIYGGGERLFLDERDFEAMRDKIARYDWAREVCRKLEARTRTAPVTSPLTWGIGLDVLRLKDIATLYRITGDDSHLGELADHLVSYYRLDEPEAPLYEPGAKPSSSLWNKMMREDLRLLAAYDLVRNHPLLSGRKEALERRFTEVCNYLKYAVDQIRSDSNTTLWTVTALAAYGCMTGDAGALERAIEGRYGFKHVLGTFRDGGRFRPEGTMYSFLYVDNCLLIMAELARRGGWKEDLYEWESPRSGASLRKMCLAMFDLAQSDGQLINCGDHSEEVDVRGDHWGVQSVALFGHPELHRVSYKTELWYARLGDPRLAWIIARNPARDEVCDQFWGCLSLTHGVPEPGEARTPDARSQVLPGMGYAFLRSVQGPHYWEEPEAPTLQLRSGSRQLTHNHADWFSIVLHAGGRDRLTDWFQNWDYLCPRPGRANPTPLSGRSLNHNTVTVDMRDPGRDEPGPVTFSPLVERDGVQSISVEGEVYKGVWQKRTVVLTPKYVLDIFELRSQTPHTYDYALHARGEASYEGVKSWSSYEELPEEYGLGRIDTRASRREGNAWLLSPQAAPCPRGDFRVRFQDDDGWSVYSHVTGLAGARVIRTGTPFYVPLGGWDKKPAVPMPERNPMLLIRVKGNGARFVAVHEILSAGKSLSSLQVKTKGDRLIVRGADFADHWDLANL